MLSSAALAAPPAWQVEVVDPSGTALYTSLRIDNVGNAHVAYVAERGDQELLRYAFWDHLLKRWFTTDIAKGVSFSSLTLDSKQRPHISWADYGTGEGAKLRYAFWDGKAWKVTAVDLNSETIAYYTSIVLDAQDRPSISFYEYRGARGTETSVRMRVVMWNGKAWEVRTVDSANQSGKFNALAIDGNSRLHLAYANVNAMTAGMRYAFWNGTKWVAEIIEDQNVANESVGYSTFIAVDSKGNPHIVYANESNPSVKYAFRDGTQWKIETVDTLTKVAYPDRFGIVLSEEDVPYVGYYDAGAGSVKIAWRSGSRWVTQIVDQGGVGFTPSLGIHNGEIWVAYADISNGALKVAHRGLSGDSIEIGAPLSDTHEEAGAIDNAGPHQPE